MDLQRLVADLKARAHFPEAKFKAVSVEEQEEGYTDDELIEEHEARIIELEKALARRESRIAELERTIEDHHSDMSRIKAAVEHAFRLRTELDAWSD